MVILMWVMETPVPIPNTEVKHDSVDDTGLVRGWDSRWGLPLLYVVIVSI